MNRPGKSVFILVGEPSGDRIGGALMSGLKVRYDDLEFQGIGGDDMSAEGLRSIFPMSDLSVMGFSDVIKRLPLLLWRVRQTAQHILKIRPDVTVLIDSQVFSGLVAKYLRKKGFEGRILLYVAPSVWAWKPERAPQLKSVFDEILAVLPFEPRIMRELDGPLTSYVGHPALERISSALLPLVDDGYLTLLPGSRAGELRRHMPVMREAAERLVQGDAFKRVAFLATRHSATILREMTAEWSIPVTIAVRSEEREEVLRLTRVALATAGTVTLELALAGVPMIGTYVPDKRLMHHYEKAGRPMIALPNIILGERLIPEIAPSDHLADDLVAEVKSLIQSPKALQAQCEAFARMRNLMLEGESADARQNAVDRIVNYLK